MLILRAISQPPKSQTAVEKRMKRRVVVSVPVTAPDGRTLHVEVEREGSGMIAGLARASAVQMLWWLVVLFVRAGFTCK